MKESASEGVPGLYERITQKSSSEEEEVYMINEDLGERYECLLKTAQIPYTVRYKVRRGSM